MLLAITEFTLKLTIKMTKFKVLEAEYNGLKFKIEEDLPEIGVYLYVFDDKKCIKDFLQNTIAICKEIAFEDYGVPMDLWKESSSS